MSIGFSSTRSGSGLCVGFWLAGGAADLFIALEVISARGVPGCSGELGMSSCGAGVNDGKADDLRLRAGAVLFLLRGDAAFFVGDGGSILGTASSGSKISVGSMLSPVLVLRVFVDFLGDRSRFAVVCRRVDFRGLARLGAGVNSSSCSSWTVPSSSSDSSSTTTFLRVARRVGRDGVAADIVRYETGQRGCVVWWSVREAASVYTDAFI